MAVGLSKSEAAVNSCKLASTKRCKNASVVAKGEQQNALRRAVFFNRLGEIRDRSYENQRHRASGLNLLVAAIILWNTTYLQRAVGHLRKQGHIRHALIWPICRHSAGSTSI